MVVSYSAAPLGEAVEGTAKALNPGATSRGRVVVRRGLGTLRDLEHQ